VRGRSAARAGFVEELEAKAIAGERRLVGALDDFAVARRRQQIAHDRDDAELGAGMRDQLAAADRRRRIEQVNAEKVRAQRRRVAGAQIRDRQPRRYRRDDRIGTAQLVEQRQHLALGRDVFGDCFENEIGVAERSCEIAVVGACGQHAVGDRALGELLRTCSTGGCLFRRAREQHRANSGGGEDRAGARTHDTVSAENYDLLDRSHEVQLEQAAYRRNEDVGSSGCAQLRDAIASRHARWQLRDRHRLGRMWLVGAAAVDLAAGSRSSAAGAVGVERHADVRAGGVRDRDALARGR
jgi:hypothetical protein